MPHHWPGKKWKVLGQSFGGLTAFRYIELFPNSLQSAHIHGFGFVPKGVHLLDERERELKKVGLDFLAYSNPKREYLTEEEILKVEEVATDPENHKQYRNAANWFLFSCYTGLRYQDVADFNKKSIESLNNKFHG